MLSRPLVHEAIIVGTAVRIGAPGWDRTSNPCLRRAVLYPLSYGRTGCGVQRASARYRMSRLRANAAAGKSQSIPPIRDARPCLGPNPARPGRMVRIPSSLSPRIAVHRGYPEVGGQSAHDVCARSRNSRFSRHSGGHWDYNRPLFAQKRGCFLSTCSASWQVAGGWQGLVLSPRCRRSRPSSDGPVQRQSDGLSEPAAKHGRCFDGPARHASNELPRVSCKIESSA